MVTADYLATGGDNMDFFRNPVRHEPLNIKLRDAIIGYISREKNEGRAIGSRPDGRIYYADQKKVH